MQRSALTGGQRALARSARLGGRAAEVFVEGLAVPRSMSRGGTEFAKVAVDTSIDAVAATVPGAGRGAEDVRAAAEAGFDRWVESQEASWDSLERALREAVAAYDELADGYVESVDAATDAALDVSEQMESDVTRAVEVPVEE